MRLQVLILLLSAAAVMTANASRLSLPALDDCHYARKGVEMARSGHFYTVTWRGELTTQHPPLQFFILGRSFAALGENDLAARLPSALMALAILAAVYRIGSVLLSKPEAVTAVALLLASPNFVNNARRCMLEIPLTFWVVLAFLVWIEGQRRAWVLALMAIPLGAAILTKSVLGLLPIVVLLAAAPWSPAVRRCLRSPWIWIGIAGGLALGASWLVQQWLRFGYAAVAAHVGNEVLGRSLAPLGLARRLTDYPKVLVESYEPVAPLAAAGAFLLLRRWRERRDEGALLLVLWAFLPVVVYSFSSARSPRYLFATFPGLALCAGSLASAWPRVAELIRRVVVPAAMLAGAVLYWTHPALLQKQGTATFKAEWRTFKERVPGDEAIAYLGSNFWTFANPLQYYTDTRLDYPSATAEQTIAKARSGSSGLLFIDADRWEQVSPLVPNARVLLGEESWLLLDVGGANEKGRAARHRGESRAGRPY